MNLLKQRWQTTVLLAMLVGLVAVAFWWFQIRPGQIKSRCQELASQGRDSETENGDVRFSVLEFTARQGVQESIDILYRNCIRREGL